MADALLEVIDVSKRYDAVARVAGVEAPVVLRSISLRVNAGESLAVVGPSGSGKSTLLHIIGGLERPTSGRVLLEGRDLAVLSERELAQVRNRRIGFVFQAHHLLPQCTALENILVPTLVNHREDRSKDFEARAVDLLERVGLGKRLHHRPAQLSGGECQRVAVVRALINEPRLVLADEPTGSLDQASGEGLGELLGRLNREQRVAVVAVTHSPRLAARMERVLELRDGRLAPSPGALT
jgi:ABC-type lipoprotein export system ATPase subunit